MNASASKASLASSSEKPSTANSSGKTRTIIVARTIHEEPAKVTPATRSDVVNQHHSRDTRSGKLASYAALGGADDVERFDQFLAEQRGQPSASELRAAATSPHHMLASMKRKTTSRIQLEGIDVKSEEKENDARKRREEAVAHRKWLNSLPIHERVSQQRQQNALRKWRQMNRDWETFKIRAARRLGKAPQELVMSRAAAYREQREMYDALQKARPLSDKVGEDIWLVSLRNEGTRYVPVGNIFSGLFCPIRESTKLGPRVRRPLDYYDNQENREHETSRPMSKLEKRSLSLLSLDHSASSHLAVGTTDLFAWASGETEESKVGDDEGSVRSYSMNEEEASRRRRLRSYASPSPKTKTEGVSNSSQFIGPSLRIAHVSDEESGLTPESNDPEACLPPLRLSFYTPVNEQDQRSLSIANDGNTVVHYQWWRAPFEDENAELTTHLRGYRTRKEEQELGQMTTISLSKLGGTLLPGETQQFVFTFKSSKAGVFLEKWFLDADPRPRICFGLAPVDADTESTVKDFPVEVRLSCVAEDNFSAWRRREMQLTRVEQRESHFFVANIVDEILDEVRPPEPVEFNALIPRNDVDRFYGQNCSDEFSDVYFSPELMRDCHALYERAQGILRALTPVEPVKQDGSSKENVLDSGAEGVGNASNGASTTEQNGSTESAVDAELQQTTPDVSMPAHLVEEWNWRLKTLGELCKMADEAQNIQIHRLSQQLKKEIEEVEEEDENEDEEDEEDAEEETDDEESDNEDETIVEKPPRLSPREVRKMERLARREALEDELTTLKLDLQETFDMLRFAAHTAPYTSSRLQERLHERLGSLCGELPVVCEIAQTMNSGSNLSVVQAAEVEGVGKLIIRAIDEAIGGDQDHQALFERERRRLQNMWLSDKASYLSISRWIDKAAASTSLPLAESTNSPPSAQNSEHLDRSGVMLMQVDLDLAPWFSLVKAEAKENAIDGAPRIELTWRFSQELVQHESFVPAKVVEAAESLEKVLNALSGVHTVVLVSELSRPPLTRQMHKLLRTAAQADLKAKTIATDQTTGETEENKTQGGDEEAEVAIMKSILERLSSQLSLRSVAQVMQRAVHKDVVFCSAVEDVQSQIDLSRKELQLDTSVSLDEASGDAADAGMSPRIVLLEHLDAAGIDLITHASRKRELAASKPATPVPEAQKPAVGGKKTSVKGKPAAPAAPAPAPPANNPSVRDLTKLELSGKELSEKGALALRTQFMRMASACVMDGIPSPGCESVFEFPPKADATPMIAGPKLSKELEIWSQILQPMVPGTTRSNQPRTLTAVVGGKCLESKLRLIDGLLEFVHEIYFVGEVAMSLYRVLHTKASKSATLNHVEMKLEEEEEELEEDAEVSKEEPLETEPNEPSSEKELGDHSKGLWDLLVPAVEKLQQKASRKCVRLLLPLDWIVGETPLEEQDLTAGVVEDSDEDEEEEEEEEEEEIDEEENSRKRKKSQIKSARQKPLVEPDHADVYEQKRQYAYEGERAHVVLNYARQKLPDAGWRTFEDVTAQCLPNARVTEGKPSVLASFYPDSEGDDADEEGDDAAMHKSPPAKFPYDWTFRALDVGPIAMETLAKILNQDCQEPTSDALTQSRAVLVNGVCGAVEFYEFSAATKQLLRILLDYSPHKVFLAGSSTASWVRQLEQLGNMVTGQEKSDVGTNSNASVSLSAPACVRKVVDDRAMRNARVLKQLIAAKPHPILAGLVSSDSM
ncbi:hypothetical protein PC123_g12658 [Phytophthora cactorum]|nr:hypothetical protein PC123_g12658 [Phytophthora cactorum]